MVQLLTYEEELEISDALHGRRKVRLDLRDRPGDAPNAEEARAIARGNDQATRLVEAYIPFLRSLAFGVKLHRDSRGSVIDVDDLIQTGVEAALGCTNAFDARGGTREDPEKGRPGLRFSSYCRMHVLREMNRFVAKASTPVYANVDVISATWAWMAAKAELSAKLGREPSDEEVSEVTKISPDYILKNLPSRVGMLDSAEENVANASVIEAEVAALADTEMYNGILEASLRDVLDETVVKVFLALLGADIGVPRSITEAARHLGMKRSEVAFYDAFSRDVLRHPQSRVALARAIQTRRGDIEI